MLNRFTFIEIRNNTATASSNTSAVQDCQTPQTFHSFTEFTHCYTFFFARSYLISILEILLILAIVSFNLLLILMIYFKPRPRLGKHLSCFDQIYIGHATVNGLTGLLDVPLFHVENIFEYWPLGSYSSLYWACFDNSINTITALHMFYMSYVRMRSLVCPHSFANERLIRSPALSMLGIWVLGAAGKCMRRHGLVAKAPV